MQPEKGSKATTIPLPLWTEPATPLPRTPHPGAHAPGSPKSNSPAPLAPMSCAEMQARGWDEVDVVFVTGDAYVDHPSFAMAILQRVLEAAGFKVAMLSQPDWHSCEPWRQ